MEVRFVTGRYWHPRIHGVMRHLQEPNKTLYLSRVPRRPAFVAPMVQRTGVRSAYIQLSRDRPAKAQGPSYFIVHADCRDTSRHISEQRVHGRTLRKGLVAEHLLRNQMVTKNPTSRTHPGSFRVGRHSGLDMYASRRRKTKIALGGCWVEPDCQMACRSMPSGSLHQCHSSALGP
jgi:hypothetical protein